MNHLKSLILIVLLYNVSCSVDNNQECVKENLLKNAAKGESTKILSCYASGANVLVSAVDGKSIYTIARENGYAKLAKSLQEIQIKEWRKRGSKYEAQDLYDAIEYNNMDLVSLFINAGFDIKAKHINGVAPAVYAVFNESDDVLNLLLNNGVDASFEFDFRPLICIAAMFNQRSTVELLVNHGADVNAMDGSRVTTLMFAARDGSTDLIKYLLAQGADTTPVDLAGNTALDMAKTAGHKAVITLLGE